jgi:hypothetical protein
LEQGHVYFFYRAKVCCVGSLSVTTESPFDPSICFISFSKVDHPEVQSMDDVRALYIVLASVASGNQVQIRRNAELGKIEQAEKVRSFSLLFFQLVAKVRSLSSLLPVSHLGNPSKRDAESIRETEAGQAGDPYGSGRSIHSKPR